MVWCWGDMHGEVIVRPLSTKTIKGKYQTPKHKKTIFKYQIGLIL